jgi:RNA polymerase sigma-70 factor, ECF subfamily
VRTRRFEDVLAAARRGDAAACTELYDGLKQAVVSFVRLRGAQDPDDVTSEVFLQVFRGLDTFRGDEAGFRAWVFTIARRRVLDDRRARARRPRSEPLVEDRAAPDGDVETEALGALGDDRVAAMLADLTADQREIVLLRILADLSLQDVADVTGRSVGAVKALQHRAMGALRTSLSAQAVTHAARAAIQ